MLRFIFAFIFKFAFFITHSYEIRNEICVSYFSGTNAPRILKFSKNTGYDLVLCER